jgi:serine/threonine protein phosphatase 1
MRTLAIGDIHGCARALDTLLQAARPKVKDQLVFLGDYIDRGPASREVIQFLEGLRKVCSPIFLRGNHEEMILDALRDSTQSMLWQSCGGSETLESYGVDWLDRNPDLATALPREHWEFLERTARFFENERHIFVHACLDSDLDMNEQPDWLLYWESFDVIRPHKSGKQVICGHSHQRSGKINNVGFAVCIDTGAVYGGWLTCLDVDSGEYWQANESGEVRGGRLKR